MSSVVIVADDDPDAAELLGALAADAGWRDVRRARSGHDAVAQWREALKDGPVDAVLLDNRMPDMNGIEAAERILRERPGTMVVLISAVLDDQTTAEARRIGVHACVDKASIQQLPAMLRAWQNSGGMT